MDVYKQYHNIHKFFQNRFAELIISDTLRGFGLSLIGLFIPFFLFTMGFTFRQILLYEVILLSVSLVAHYLVDVLLPKLGLKHGLIISYVLIVLYMLILLNFSFMLTFFSDTFLLVTLGITSAFAFAFYWMSHHHYFIDATEYEHRGEELGLLVSIPLLINIASPFLGGFLITFYGYPVTFLVVILLLVAASFFLVPKEEMHDKLYRNNKKIICGFGVKQNLVYLIEGFMLVSAGLLWPLLLYYLGVSLIDIGLLYVGAQAMYALISYISGKKSDSFGVKMLVSLGVIGEGFSLIFRTFARTRIAFVVFHIMGGLFAPLWILPVHSVFFKLADVDPSNSILNRELYAHIGKLLSVFLVFVFAFFTSVEQAMVYVIIVSGFLMFTFLILVEDEFSVKKI